jgi:hypothetical protein
VVVGVADDAGGDDGRALQSIGKTRCHPLDGVQPS